jgi:hypothetical protein
VKTTGWESSLFDPNQSSLVKIHLNKIYKMLELHSKIELVMAVGKLPRVKARVKEDGSGLTQRV